MGLKDFFNKLKEENRNMGTTMKRINSSNYFGEVNRGIKNGDFWEGSYVSIEGDHGVIYGSNQDDYTFSASNITAFEHGSGSRMIALGNEKKASVRYIISFADGKKAQMDIFADKIDSFKLSFNL